MKYLLIFFSLLISCAHAANITGVIAHAASGRIPVGQVITFTPTNTPLVISQTYYDSFTAKVAVKSDGSFTNCCMVVGTYYFAYDPPTGDNGYICVPNSTATWNFTDLICGTNVFTLTNVNNRFVVGVAPGTNIVTSTNNGVVTVNSSGGTVDLSITNQYTLTNQFSPGTNTVTTNLVALINTASNRTWSADNFFTNWTASVSNLIAASDATTSNVLVSFFMSASNTLRTAFLNSDIVTSNGVVSLLVNYQGTNAGLTAWQNFSTNVIANSASNLVRVLGSANISVSLNSTNGTNFYVASLAASPNISGNLTVQNLNVSHAVVTDDGKTLVSSSATDVELAYLSGVTSGIQGQFTSVTGTLTSQNTSINNANTTNAAQQVTLGTVGTLASNAVANLNGLATNTAFYQQTGSTTPGWAVYGSNGVLQVWVRTNQANGSVVFAIGTNLTTATCFSNWNGMTYIITSNGAPAIMINGGNGNVGIGTANSDSGLQVVSGSSSLRINFTSTGNNYVDGIITYFRGGGGVGNIMTLNSTGVLIGSSTVPSYKLHVVGDAYIPTNAAPFTFGATATSTLITNRSQRGSVELDLAFDDVTGGNPSCTIIVTNLISTNSYPAISPNLSGLTLIGTVSCTNHYFYRMLTNGVMKITDTSSGGAAVRVVQSLPCYE